MSRVLLCLCFALTACGVQPDEPILDQCMRVALFQSCMKSLPAGPTSTQYNDWDEVVDSCASAAMYQSYRRAEFVEPKCRFR